MEIKSKKGFTGIDLVVAITIILIAVGTITTVYVSINKTYRETNRTSIAGKIATDIMTAIDVSHYFEIQETIDAAGHDNPIVVSGNYNNNDSGWEDLVKCIGSGAMDLKIPNGYTVELSVGKADEEVIEKKELLKKIKFKISFLVSGEEKSVEFVTYKGRYGAIVPDKPFTDFLNDAKYRTDNFEYTPIKYNRLNNIWETTVFGDNTWYEYGEGVWPVMVRTQKDVEPLKDGKINTAQCAVALVWFQNIVYDTSSNRYYICATIADKYGNDRFYLFNRKNINTTYSTDEGTENIICQYDEIDYTKEMSTTVIKEGWYNITVDSENNIKATNILNEGTVYTEIGTFCKYVPSADSELIVNTLELTNDIYIYESKDNKIKSMINFPLNK